MSQIELDDAFQLEFTTPEKARVCVFSDAEASTPWSLIAYFDEAKIRVEAKYAGPVSNKEAIAHQLSGCNGVAFLLPHRISTPSTTCPDLLKTLRIAASVGLPILLLHESGVKSVGSGSMSDPGIQFGTEEPFSFEGSVVWGPGEYNSSAEELDGRLVATLEQYCGALYQHRDQNRPYAFFVGRLERDFTHAREAIRMAVAHQTGMPCLWADDGCHRTNIESIRESTRLLIKNAAFVIADLTLGVESPKRANPSRAHEIGLALAYGKKLLLCSKEPRRYPYFSIGDLQIFFWSDEKDLYTKVEAWIKINQLARTGHVLNYALEKADKGIGIPEYIFNYDPQSRYVGPQSITRVLIETALIGTCMVTIFFSIAYLLNMALSYGSSVYWASSFLAAFVTLVFFHESGKRNVSSRMKWFIRTTSIAIMLVLLVCCYFVDS